MKPKNKFRAKNFASLFLESSNAHQAKKNVYLKFKHFKLV